MADENDMPGGTMTGTDDATHAVEGEHTSQAGDPGREGGAAPGDAPPTPPFTQTLKDTAATMTKNVGDKARSYAEDGKTRAGNALDELVQMMHDAAGTVDEKIGAQYGQYARTAADTVSSFSDSIKSKNVDDLIADATGLVKKSPAIAIGTAAALGFVLVRLIQSGVNAETDDQA